MANQCVIFLLANLTVVKFDCCIDVALMWKVCLMFVQIQSRGTQADGRCGQISRQSEEDGTGGGRVS